MTINFEGTCVCFFMCVHTPTDAHCHVSTYKNMSVMGTRKALRTHAYSNVCIELYMDTCIHACASVEAGTSLRCCVDAWYVDSTCVIDAYVCVHVYMCVCAQWIHTFYCPSILLYVCTRIDVSLCLCSDLFVLSSVYTYIYTY